MNESKEQNEQIADDVVAIKKIVTEHLPHDSYTGQLLGKVSRHEIVALIVLIEMIFEPIRSLLGV